MVPAAVVYSSIPTGGGVSSIHGLSYTSPNCLIIPVLSDGWQCHNICIVLACIQRSQNLASIDGRGGKWRIKSSSLIDSLNIASSRNSWLGHVTKVLSSILEYVVTRKQRWKPLRKTALSWPHAWHLLPTSKAPKYDVTKTRPAQCLRHTSYGPPTSTKNHQEPDRGHNNRQRPSQAPNDTESNFPSTHVLQENRQSSA